MRTWRIFLSNTLFKMCCHLLPCWLKSILRLLTFEVTPMVPMKRSLTWWTRLWRCVCSKHRQTFATRVTAALSEVKRRANCSTGSMMESWTTALPSNSTHIIWFIPSGVLAQTLLSSMPILNEPTILIRVFIWWIIARSRIGPLSWTNCTLPLQTRPRCYLADSFYHLLSGTSLRPSLRSSWKTRNLLLKYIISFWRRHLLASIPYFIT